MAESSRLPSSIWKLGFVSLLMDVSSETVHGLLPVFLVTGLGASLGAVGWLEGAAEAAVLVVKTLSGPLSDKLGRRKPLVVLGYAMGALSKPLFAVAPSVAFVFGARLFDRTGKGIRGAPRDALVADLAPQALRGRAFGLRQSLDTVGAFVGPALAIALMAWTGDDYRTVFWVATIPGLLAVLLLWLGVEEPERQPTGAPPKRLEWKQALTFPRAFWAVALAGALFQLARFSEAFLVLRAKDVGLPLAWSPLVLVIANVASALTSYPAGHLSDRFGRKGFLLLGMLCLVVSDVLLALAPGLPLVLAGIVVWGLHTGFSQGILAALVADACPAERRGTAYGVFSLCSALALLLASVVAGTLWERFGPRATFLAGAAFCFWSAVGLLATRRGRLS